MGSEFINTKIKTKAISSDTTLTIADIVAGKAFMINTTSGDITLTLPAKSEIPNDGDIHRFYIGHTLGSNDVILQCNGAETFVYSNTYINLGSRFVFFPFGAINQGGTQQWGLQRDLVIYASAHRDAVWGSGNFSSVTIIPWDQEPDNTQDELFVYTDGANARYTVKTPGTYRINYTVDIDSTGSGTWNANAQVYKNGGALEATKTRTGNYGYEDQSMALPDTKIDLIADDYLDIRIVHNNLAGNLVHCMFNIELTL